MPYKFIRDATHPMRSWFYSPFKGEKEGLPKAKTYRNFIQLIGKGFWSFERIVEDPNEDIGYTIMRYTRRGYGLHFGASMLIRTTHAHLCDFYFKMFL